MLQYRVSQSFLLPPLTGAVEVQESSALPCSSCLTAQHAEWYQYLWGGREAPLRNGGAYGLPAVILGLPVLCGVAHVTSVEGVIAQGLFQRRGQWAGRSEVLGRNGWWGRDRNGWWSALHPWRR